MEIQQNKLKFKKPARTVILCIVFGIALMAAAFRLLVSGVNTQIRETNVKSMEELALHDQKSIKNSIELRWDTMEGVAERMQAYRWQSEDELVLTMKDLIKNIPSVEKIILLDADGTEYGSSGLVRKDSYLTDICRKHTERFIDRVNTTSYFRENRNETLFEAIPVDFEVCGHRMQWMLCLFTISVLEKELKIDSYGGEGFSSVIDAEGNYIINVSRNHSFGTYDNFFRDLADAEIEGFENAQALLATTTTTGAQSAIYIKDGRENIMVITTIDYAGWYFITTVPTSVFSTQANAILRLFLLLLAAVAAVVVAIVYVYFRQRQQSERLRLAEASSKSKTEFLFNMSHDIRTPMNAILGYTDIGLRHKEDAERVNESLKKIKIAGGHLLQLINDILEMSRSEAGRLVLTNAPLDMRKSINGVVLMNQSLATAKSLAFTVDGFTHIQRRVY